jgi:hypothetical protein
VQHLNSIRAALKANGTAPVLAIPVPGHAPICVRAKLLKGALKGVTIDSVKVLENRWLEVRGRACGLLLQRRILRQRLRAHVRGLRCG